MHDKLKQAISDGNYPYAAELIEECLETDPSFARQHSILFAHVLVMAARWGLISQLVPAGTNYFSESGWLLSLVRGKPVDKAGAPIPWITYPTIDFIEPRLKSEWKVFEYGGGQSTLWWAGKVAQVHTVEHDPQWVETLEKELPGNATLDLKTSQDEYVRVIADSPYAPFDVVVIDAQYRNECALFSPSYVKDDGIIIFDNSDRILYREGLQHLSDAGWKRLDFFGLIPSYLYKNCTSIFYRNDSWMSCAILPGDQELCTGATCSQTIKQ